MAIYSRDNLQLQGAIDAALRNRQAYRDRQDARLKDSLRGVGEAAKAFGRWYELDKADLDKKLEQLKAEKKEAEEYTRAYNERMKEEYGTAADKKAAVAEKADARRAFIVNARNGMAGYTPYPVVDMSGYSEAMGGRPLVELENEYRRII